MSKGYEKRLRLLSIFILFIALALIARLYQIQIINNSVYKDRAEHQYVAGANYFDRGSIFFTTKDGSHVPAASLKSGFILSINPSVIAKNANAETVFEKLSSITTVDRSAFFAKAGKINDTYEELAKHLPQETADAISKLKLQGVSVYKERWRYYPGGSLAAQTIGFIGYQGDDLGGRYGLERYYEKVLGRSGDDAFVNFFAEIFSNVKKIADENESPQGDVVTTIEPSVQAFLESELRKVNEKYSSEFTGGIIINPKTGEIYAMGTQPAFDPNIREDVKDVGVFRNKLVEDRYEMGSIIKTLGMAVGLDTGAVTAKTRFNDPGCMTLNTETFCNYDLKSHGYNLPMQAILNQSLNTGAAWVALKVGRKTFADYYERFGLASTTGIDLPNEGKSLVSNLRVNRDLEIAQASFGQGIALTPIQTVRAMSVLANGGTLITPHLVKEIQYNIGTKKTIEYPAGERVLKPETSEEISRMLTEVVDTALREGGEKLPNYSVAAKTGTAQIAGPGGYYEDRYLHSFFGYFPAYDAKFLVFFYTYYPKEVQYASETLTDVFIETTKFLINYYNIPPDREGPPPATARI